MAKKILIVEDEPDQRTWLETFFADNDYETISAEDGQIGFEKAKSEKPDLITLDISMDNESGIKMFRNVQETPETSAIPVIMITGVSVMLFSKRSKNLSGDPVVTRPHIKPGANQLAPGSSNIMIFFGI